MIETKDELEKRPMGDLVGSLLGQLGGLIRNEFELAERELLVKVRRLAIVAALAGAAVTFALMGGVALLITVIALLRLVMPLWGAALVTGGCAMAGAAILALVTRWALENVGPLVPELTLRTLKEDVEWAKARVSSNRA